MPTYNYACEACGHEWELEQRISENPVKKCPECGKMKARRMISGSGNFILKGAGWYSDLYHKPKTASSDKPTSSSDSKETKPAESKPSAESKPADKPKPKATSD